MLIISSCTKDELELKTSGEFTLDLPTAFSFVTCDTMRVFGAQTPIIQLIINSSMAGEYHGIMLTGEGTSFSEAINNNGSGYSETEFDQLKNVPDSITQFESGTSLNPFIKENDIIIAKTVDGKYAKLWIRQIKVVKEAIESTISIKYVFQPNDTKYF